MTSVTFNPPVLALIEFIIKTTGLLFAVSSWLGNHLLDTGNRRARFSRFRFDVNIPKK